jgi:rubrerythrin
MPLKDVMQQAIQFEEEAHDFYITAMKLVESDQAKTVLGDLAEQEKSHKQKLAEVMETGLTWAQPIDNVEERIDLEIGEHLMPGELTAQSDLQDALAVALKREQASYEFYANMADVVCPESKALFLFLADEEAKHKNSIQAIYDEIVYQDF